MNKKQYLSFTLALLIMSTRVGFALNIHYCGHQIAEISLASNPSNCGMEIDQDYQLPEHTSFSKTPCCKDQTLLFQNNEPQKFETESKNFCIDLFIFHSTSYKVEPIHLKS